MVGAAAGVNVDGAGAGVRVAEAEEGSVGAADRELAVIQFHQPKGQEAASAGADAPISSPPAAVRVITEAAIRFLSFNTRRTVHTAYAALHIE